METTHLQHRRDVVAETPASQLGAGGEDGASGSPGKDAS
jgi:hypothetical protein